MSAKGVVAGGSGGGHAAVAASGVGGGAAAASAHHCPSRHLAWRRRWRARRRHCGAAVATQHPAALVSTAGMHAPQRGVHIARQHFGGHATRSAAHARARTPGELIRPPITATARPAQRSRRRAQSPRCSARAPPCRACPRPARGASRSTCSARGLAPGAELLRQRRRAFRRAAPPAARQNRGAAPERRPPRPVARLRLPARTAQQAPTRRWQACCSERYATVRAGLVEARAPCIGDDSGGLGRERRAIERLSRRLTRSESYGDGGIDRRHRRRPHARGRTRGGLVERAQRALQVERLREVAMPAPRIARETHAHDVARQSARKLHQVHDVLVSRRVHAPRAVESAPQLRGVEEVQLVHRRVDVERCGSAGTQRSLGHARPRGGVTVAALGGAAARPSRAARRRAPRARRPARAHVWRGQPCCESRTCGATRRARPPRRCGGSAGPSSGIMARTRVAAARVMATAAAARWRASRRRARPRRPRAARRGRVPIATTRPTTCSGGCAGAAAAARDIRGLRWRRCRRGA